MGASGKTVAVDATSSRTVQSTEGGIITMLGDLTMCELSVDDGEQQIEQDEVDRNRCNDCNDRIEKGVQNEIMNGHKNASWVQKR